MITIVLQGRETNYGVVGRPEAEVALAALDTVRNDILLMVASQQAQQPQGKQEDVSEEELAQIIEKIEEDEPPNKLAHGDING